MITKQDWIDCGNARKDLEIDEVSKAIGAKVPDGCEDFESVCAFVHLVLTGEKLPPCNLRGRGFRSQWHGRQISEIWDKAKPSTP